MILEDFVMLGTTVPEPNVTDGRVFVCSAGVSEECRQLVRIYPLARRNIPARWGTYRVRLARNRRDSRRESFQVGADRTTSAHEHINDVFEEITKAIPPSTRPGLLSRYIVGSIREANEKRLSLAIIQPEHMDLNFDTNPENVATPQLVLFDTGGKEEQPGARRFPYMPRLHFRDEYGEHNLMLRDWGAFELQRKHGGDYFVRNLETALKLTAASSLLVGNMNNQRTAWLVISVLNGLREAPSLFDELPSADSSLSGGLKQQIFARDNWRCTGCGSGSALSIVKDSSTFTPHSGDRLDDFLTVCHDCIASRSTN